jgi:hypothetical protein
VVKAKPFGGLALKRTVARTEVRWIRFQQRFAIAAVGFAKTSTSGAKDRLVDEHHATDEQKEREIPETPHDILLVISVRHETGRRRTPSIAFLKSSIGLTP